MWKRCLRHIRRGDKVHLLITVIVVSCLVFVVNDIHVTVEVNDVTMLFYLQNFELSSANDENHLR